MVAAPADVRRAERATLRMAIPSKGRMAEDTLQLLKVIFLALMAVLPWTCGLALCPDAKKATVLCAGMPAKRVQAQPAAVHSHHLAGGLCLFSAYSEHVLPL